MLVCALLLAVSSGAGARDRAAASAPLFSWLAALAAEAMVEEGLTTPPAGERNASGGPLREGGHPFWDGGARGRSAAEWGREALMAPIALGRCAVFWGGLLCYGLFVNAVVAAQPDARRRHALLVPVTRVLASALLWVCGYTARAPAR